MEGRVILTTKYDLVEKVNATMTQMILSPIRDYFSADSIEDTDQPHLYPTEFLNSTSQAFIAGTLANHAIKKC